MRSLLYLFILLLLSNCTSGTENTAVQLSNKSSELKGLHKAYFASGCFWCVEEVFESVVGVEEVVSGYSGGEIKNPTYEQVSSGKTKHAEAVEVYYNPEKVSYQTLVKVFFASHDPSTKNRQGPDAGTQYRSMIFYQNEGEKKIASEYITSLVKAKTFSQITTELVPFKVFWKAEDYHQDYIKKHPNHPYVVRVSIPRFEAFKKKMPEVLKK